MSDALEGFRIDFRWVVGGLLSLVVLLLGAFWANLNSELTLMQSQLHAVQMNVVETGAKTEANIKGFVDFATELRAELKDRASKDDVNRVISDINKRLDDMNRRMEDAAAKRAMGR
jgi:hypothetical protein